MEKLNVFSLERLRDSRLGKLILAVLCSVTILPLLYTSLTAPDTSHGIERNLHPRERL